MRTALTVLIFLAPAMAQAHAGHVVGDAAHDAWVLGAALGAAIAAAAWSKWKEKSKADEDAAPEEEAEA